ncbi:hypothetical protein Ntsu_28730 [Nocardia sp. IFM 10818]
MRRAPRESPTRTTPLGRTRYRAGNREILTGLGHLDATLRTGDHHRASAPDHATYPTVTYARHVTEPDHLPNDTASYPTSYIFTL